MRKVESKLSTKFYSCSQERFIFCPWEFFPLPLELFSLSSSPFLPSLPSRGERVREREKSERGGERVSSNVLLLARVLDLFFTIP